MAKSMARLGLALGAMTLVSGCQTFSPNLFTHQSKNDRTTAEQNKTRFTLEGAKQLRAGNVGQAIDAYNYALATGEEPASAYNGLGVAYARLGRADLAYRFFKKAMMGDPDNAVFARNLAQLMESPDFQVAMARQREQRSAASLSSATVGKETVANAAPVREPGRLVRDGNRQFSLITVPAPAPGLTDGRAERNSCKVRDAQMRNDECRVASLPQALSRQRKERDASAGQETAIGSTLIPQASSERDVSNGTAGKQKTIVMPVASKDSTATQKSPVKVDMQGSRAT